MVIIRVMFSLQFMYNTQSHNIVLLLLWLVCVCVCYDGTMTRKSYIFRTHIIIERLSWMTIFAHVKNSANKLTRAGTSVLLYAVLTR